MVARETHQSHNSDTESRTANSQRRWALPHFAETHRTVDRLRKDVGPWIAIEHASLRLHSLPASSRASAAWAVSGFPSYVNMYIYVPKTPAAKPPIVVVPHHCGGDASSSYSESSGLVSGADSVGFVLVFPEATGQNCWDAGSAKSLNHSGTGDAPAIPQWRAG